MIQPASTILYGIDNQTRSFLIFSGISFFGHVFIFILVAFVHFPTDSDFKIVAPTAIQVDLVSFNPEIPIPPKADKSVLKPIEPVASLDPMDQLTDKMEKLSVKPETQMLTAKKALQKKIDPSRFVVEKPAIKKVKKPITKKKINTSKVIKDAVRRIARQSKTSRPKSVADRIERLRNEVQNQPASQGISTGSTDSGNTFPRDFSQIEIYQAEVSVRLKNNWVFSEKMAGDTKGLESRLVIKILPDGRITDVWFEKRSGNTYLDNSAYKTVMKSNPLPALPEGFSYYHLVLGFTPSGLH